MKKPKQKKIKKESPVEMAFRLGYQVGKMEAWALNPDGTASTALKRWLGLK